jgi:hypothetical protein
MAKVKCLKCGKILVSKSVHNFVMCGCDNQTFVDGGDQYCRFGGVDMDFVELIMTPETEGISK